MMRRYDQIHPFPIVLVRRAGETHPIDATVALLQRCAELDPPVSFDQHRAPDMTWAVPDFTTDWLRQTLDMGDDPVQKMVGRLPLMTRHDEPAKLVSWLELHWQPHRYQIVTIDVPWAAKEADRAVVQTREQLFTLLREAAVAFGADVAALYPRSLHALVRIASGEQAHAAHTDGNGGSDQRLKHLPAFLSMLPDGLFERFTGLLPAREFDVAAVPESVWWANVWSKDVVERLGRERVLSLPWARIEPAGDGGLFLQASKALPGPKKPGALARVADLIEGLDLPAAQRAARP